MNNNQEHILKKHSRLFPYPTRVLLFNEGMFDTERV